MSPLYELLAVIAGMAGGILGVCMLAGQYKDSPYLQRFAIGGIVCLNFVVALDGIGSLQPDLFGTPMYFDLEPRPIEVAFSAALSIYWLHKLLRTKRMT